MNRSISLVFALVFLIGSGVILIQPVKASADSPPWVQITAPNSSQLAIQATSISFMTNALGFDMSRYNATGTKFFLLSPDMNPEFGNLPHYNIEYNLTSTDGNTVRMIAEFLNGTLIHYILYGPNSKAPSPHYVQPLPTTFSGATIALLTRYQNFTGAAYIQPMLDMLNKYSIDEMLGSLNKTAFGGSSASVTENNMKMKISDGNVLSWTLSIGGVDFPNVLTFGFDNYGKLEDFSDWWNLYKISTNVNISQGEAANIAWTLANSVKTVYFGGVGDVTVHFVDKAWVYMYGAVRENLTAYPFYYVQIPTDKAYYKVSGFEVGIWADNGQIAFSQMASLIQPSSSGTEFQPNFTTLPSPSPSPTPSPTASPTPSPSLSPVPTPAASQQPTQSPQPQPGTQQSELVYAALAATVVIVIIVAAAVAVSRRKQ